MKQLSLTDQQQRQIVSILRSKGAIVGYLFGSYARGTAGVLSDIDIGVVFPNELASSEQADRVEEIRSDLENIFGRDKVDVVNVVAVTNPVLRYAITLGEGRILFSEDLRVHNRIADYARREYEDTKPLRRIQHQVLLKMIAK